MVLPVRRVSDVAGRICVGDKGIRPMGSWHCAAVAVIPETSTLYLDWTLFLVCLLFEFVGACLSFRAAKAGQGSQGQLQQYDTIITYSNTAQLLTSSSQF